MMRLLFLLLSFIPLVSFGQAEEGVLLGTWNQPGLVGSNAYNNIYNEVWGVARGGKEFAIIGSTAGTHFIDVTTPATPTESFFIPGKAQGGAIIHRDYHDYGDYLYAVADEGNSSLQILDLSQLPDTVTVAYDSNELFRTVHNIFIDSSQAILYGFAMSGGGQGYSALRLYDISDPLNPNYLAEYNTFGSLNVGHVHDGYVRNGKAFLNCGPSGFALVDFTDPLNPETMSVLESYTQAGYNHSGWMSEDCQYYYMADENHGLDIKVMDVTNPCEVEIIGTFDEGTPISSTITHNQVVACDYLYVSYYYNGVIVYDISNPATPERVMYYDTSPLANSNSYEGAWGVYPFLPSGNILVSDMQEGLFVIEAIDGACTSTAATNDCSLNTCGNVNSTHDQALVETITVFPQPAKDELNLNIKLTTSKKEVNIELLDINGKLLKRLETTSLTVGENQLTLPLSITTPGLYFLHLTGNNLNLTQKVIIE